MSKIKSLSRKFFVFMICLCACVEMSAQGRTQQDIVDSLFADAQRLLSQGAFAKSNDGFTEIMRATRLDKANKKSVFGYMSVNSLLDGDYRSYYKYAKKARGRKRASNLKPFRRLPKEALERPYDDVTIGYSLDTLSYEGSFRGYEIRVPVEIGGREEMMILDNGCAIYSTASESFARKCGIRPIGIKGSANGAVDEVDMWFGIADSLKIGGLTLRNVVFDVIPDKYLVNPVLDINAMLGANIFRMIGEMIFDNNRRTITFPLVQRRRLPNISIDTEGVHYMDVAVTGNGDVADDSQGVQSGEMLRMQLDLGSAKTELNSNYYERYREKIRSSFESSSALSGGVGGVEDVAVYMAPSLVFKAGGGQYFKRYTTIQTTADSNEGAEYGKLGNDFLLNFRRVVLNLRDMYLIAE